MFPVIFLSFANIKATSYESMVEYATCFGFSEEEVFDALDEAGLGCEKQNVKKWYDRFTFGSYSDI